MIIELAHDVIALKIWEQLPEQDKQLRLVSNSLEQRLLDYNKGDGSTLGEKEMLAWEDFFPLLKLSPEQQQFVEDSKHTIEARKIKEQQQRDRELKLTQQKLQLERRTKNRQRIFLGILSMFTIGSILLSVFAFQQSEKAKESQKVAEENLEYAESSAKSMGDVIQNLAKKRSEELFASTEIALDNYNFNKVIALADSVIINIENNQIEIEDVTEGPEILESFTQAMQPYLDKAQNYINKYQKIAQNGQGASYALKMNAIKNAINLKDFDRALALHKDAAQIKLGIRDLAIKLDKIKPMIHQTAFDYHFIAAKNGFENSYSKMGKYIAPFDQLKKMEQYTLVSDRQAVDQWFKGTFCKNINSISKEERNKYSSIEDIYKLCNN